MANMVLAYTSSGVESVALLTEQNLDSLATWLCSDNEYHYYKEANSSFRVADHEFDKQVKAQGYCNLCKDFAGEILAHFDLVRKPVSADGKMV